MKRFVLLLITVFFTQLSWADLDFLQFGDKEFAEKKSEEGKWFFKTGMEYIRYRSTFPEFKGQHENINKNEEEDIWGYGLFFGREFYFGAGLSSTFSIGAAYYKTLNKELAKAAEDIDFDVANTRRGHQILNYEASLSINYLFDNKYVDVQPFIEGAVGSGNARIEKYYQRKPVPNTADAEEYDVVTEEQYLYTRFGIGINVISYKGLTSYFKISTMLMNISEREVTGDSVAYGTTTVVDRNSKETDLDESATMTTASIGLGYMF